MPKIYRLPRKAKIILSILLPVLSCCLLSSQLFYFKCLWNCAPKRTFTAKELTLPYSFFPKKATIQGMSGLRGDYQLIDSATADVNWKEGIAIYIIRRWPTERVAKKDYLRMETNFVSDPSIETNYEKAINFDSTAADDYHVTCDIGLYDRPRCIFIARYEEFTFFFNATIGPEDMTEDNYLGVITFIDERMADLLKD